MTFDEGAERLRNTGPALPDEVSVRKAHGDRFLDASVPNRVPVITNTRPAVMVQVHRPEIWAAALGSRRSTMPSKQVHRRKFQC